MARYWMQPSGGGFGSSKDAYLPDLTPEVPVSLDSIKHSFVDVTIYLNPLQRRFGYGS
jgi:hypothetical protein